MSLFRWTLDHEPTKGADWDRIEQSVRAANGFVDRSVDRPNRKTRARLKRERKRARRAERLAAQQRIYRPMFSLGNVPWKFVSDLRRGMVG